MTEQEQKDALLTEIQNKVKAGVEQELNTRSYVKKEDVDSAVTEKMKPFEGMDLEALRTYKSEKEKTDQTLRNIAGEVEKLQNRSIEGSKSDPIREFVEKEKAQIEQRFNNPNDRVTEVRFNVRTAANMQTTNTIDNTTFSVPVTIVDSMSMDAFAKKRRGVQFINDVADRVVKPNITQYKTWLEEGNEQGAFAIVAEGALKPLVSDGVVRNFTKAKKVAGKYVVTEEFAKFYAEIYNIIRNLINDKLIRDYSAILTSDLNTLAVSFLGTTGLEATMAAPNDYDALAAVASQIMALNFVPDVLILHPNDLWRIRLSKDSQGRYLFPVQNESTGGVDMFGFTVISSTYQTPGSFTLGESGLFKIEEEPITVRMGYGVDYTTATQTASNTAGTVVTAVSSDIDTNRFRVIVETYFNDWLATPYIGSFVKASFATVKTALLKP